MQVVVRLLARSLFVAAGCFLFPSVRISGWCVEGRVAKHQGLHGSTKTNDMFFGIGKVKTNQTKDKLHLQACAEKIMKHRCPDKPFKPYQKYVVVCCITYIQNIVRTNLLKPFIDTFKKTHNLRRANQNNIHQHTYL